MDKQNMSASQRYIALQRSRVIVGGGIGGAFIGGLPSKQKEIFSYVVSQEDLDTLVNRVRLNTFTKEDQSKLLSEAFLLALTEGRIHSAEILKAQELFSTETLIDNIPTIQDQQTLKDLAKIELDLMTQHCANAIKSGGY